MGGQASHFIRYAPQGNDYAVERYRSELERLLRVLDRRLSDAEYLAGESYSIADIAIWPGRWAARSIGLAPGRHPHIDRWLSLIAARPAVKRGLEGARAAPAKYLQTEAKLTDDEWSNMFGQRMRAAPDL
jgi:GST-like protein